MERNKSIDFYRFAFCLPVILLHISVSTTLYDERFTLGGNAVEFFFVLSGFLLGRYIKKTSEKDIFVSALNKTKRQIIHIFPYYYLCLFMTLFYRIHINIKFDSYSEQDWVQFINNFVAELLCITGVSYRTRHINGPDWYVSALIIASFLVTVFVLAMKRYLKKWECVYEALSIFIFVIYIQLFDLSSRYANIVRAIVNIMIGITCYIIYTNIEKKYKNRIPIIVYDIIDIIALSFCLMCLFPNHIIEEKRIIALASGILIINQFIGKSHFSKFLDNNMSLFLGRISLPIYLGHLLVILKFANDPRYDMTQWKVQSYLTIVAASILIGIIIDLIITLVLCELKKKQWDYPISIRKIAFIISILLFVISFANEKVFFKFDNLSKSQICVYAICKIILILLYIYLPQVLITSVRKKEYHKWWRLGILIFSIYVVSILLAWPGNWVNDEFGILGIVQNFGIKYHQSFFTSIFFIVMIMIYPSCGSIILGQAVVCTIISVYIIKVIYEQYGRIAYCLLVLFFSVPTLYFILSPLRVCMYTFTFLLLVAILLKLTNKFENIDYKILGALGIVTAIVATWRTESVFLIILIPVFICINICKKINTVAVRKKMIIFFLVVSLLPFGVFRNINQLENEATKKNVLLWSFVTGLSVMLQDEDLKSPDLEEDISNIDKVMPVEEMKRNASSYDFYAIYNVIGPFEYTEEEYTKCVKSIVRLIVCNPIKYLEAKWDLFAYSSGCSSEFHWVEPANSIEQTQNIIKMYGVSEDILNIFRPLNNNLRSAYIYFLTGMYTIEGTEVLTYYFFWNFGIPIVLLMVMFVVSILRKNLTLCFVNFMILLDFALVYVAAPTTHVMYFFPFYILGYATVFYQICYFIKKDKYNHKENL